MSLYTAREEGTPRRPNTWRSRRPNRFSREKNPLFRMISWLISPLSEKLKAQDEESPPVSMLPPPSRFRKLKAKEEEIPLDSMLPSPLAAGKRKLVVPVQVQRQPWAKDPEVFADDPHVMDCSHPCNYFQHPVAHQYKAAKEEIPRVATLPSPLESGDGEPKLVFPDRIEKHPWASNQPEYASSALDNPFGPGYIPKRLEMESDKGYGEGSRAKDFGVFNRPLCTSPALNIPLRPALRDISSPSYQDPVLAISKPLEMESPKGYGKGSREYSAHQTMYHQLVMDCLRHYNSKCLGVEYELAPGEVTSYSETYKGTVWTHGNFVARRKRSGWFSFLPGPRTLFFFELRFKHASNEVITCTPLLDEPVTEGYNVLGCPFWWWSTRRSGKYDTICKTCKRRLDKGILACGHKEREELCKMCYLHAGVLHPAAAEFTFGNEKYGPRLVAC